MCYCEKYNVDNDNISQRKIEIGKIKNTQILRGNPFGEKPRAEEKKIHYVEFKINYKRSRRCLFIGL